MSKVEIQNLNTAELPRLKNSEQLELLKKIKIGNEDAREKFIYANLRLVLSIVQKFSSRYDNLDDLFQIGVVGLLKSINNFDIEQNVQFSTYAVPMIIGEIKRFLRDSSTIRISRSMRDIAYKVMQEKERFIKENNREPTIIEISEAIEEKVEDIVVALDSMVQPVSIYETVYSEGGSSISLFEQIKDDTDEAEMLTNKLTIESLLEKLSDKERNIIYKRFFLNKTQNELANEIGVSQAQISRIEKTALLNALKLSNRIPLNDLVEIKDPEVIEIDLNIDIYLYKSEFRSIDSIKSKIEDKIKKYLLTYNFGQSLNHQDIIAICKSEEVERIEIITPPEGEMQETQIIKLKTLTLNHRG